MLILNLLCCFFIWWWVYPCMVVGISLACDESQKYTVENGWKLRSKPQVEKVSLPFVLKF